MGELHPDSVIEPFEAYAYRAGYVVALVVGVLLLVVSVAVLIGAWPSGTLPGFLGFLPHQFWGVLGILYVSTMGLNILRLTLSPKPALSFSEDGVLNRTYLSSGTLVPWEDILEVKKTRFPGVRTIVLRDPAAFRRRQPLLGRFIMRLTTVLGLGPLPIHMWQLNARWVEVESRLEDGLQASQLRSVRQQQLLEGER